MDKRLWGIPWGNGGQGETGRGKVGNGFTGWDWERNAVFCVSHSGQAYITNHRAENAGVFHKGDCPACAFDDGSCLCKVRPFAEEAAENFIAS